MRKWLDLFHSETAELLADHFQLVIKTGCADRDIGGLLAHQCNQSGAGGLGVGRADECGDIRGHGGADTHIMQTDHLALVHLDAAVNLGKVFTKGDLVDQLFDLAKFFVST